MEDLVIYQTPTEAALTQVGNAKTVLEHLDHAYRISAGRLETFLHEAPPDDIYLFLLAIDTIMTHVADHHLVV